MNLRDIGFYRCPGTADPLSYGTEEQPGTEEVLTGTLLSPTGHQYEIVKGITRFCPVENYADNFGYQWNRFSKTQIDSMTRFQNRSEERLFRTTQWSRDLQGQRLLEAGSGMGRFTEVLAKTGADVWTFDYSTAVEANFGNNAKFPNVHFCQGDIYEPPFEPGSFDKVLCIGVLQHCPSPKRAFMSLARFLKPGGQICIDIYPLSLKSLFMGKYYIRPVTKRLSRPALCDFVEFQVGWVFPLTRFLYKRIGRAASALSWGLAVADFRRHVDADEDTLKQLSLLDTLDMLGPKYDRPRTVRQVASWCREAGLENIEVFQLANVIARATAPLGLNRPMGL
jgi:SAM-dependent methyltransferase